VLENQDRFWDRDHARLCTADRSGNSRRHIQNGGASDFIGSSKRVLRKSAGCRAVGRRTRPHVIPSVEKYATSDRIDAAVRLLLLLLTGPAAEALLLSGAFEPVANRLTAGVEHLHDRYLFIRDSRRPSGDYSKSPREQSQPTLASAPLCRLSAPVQWADSISPSKNNSYGGRS
jgi:hypothetical protein